MSLVNQILYRSYLILALSVLHLIALFLGRYTLVTAPLVIVVATEYMIFRRRLAQKETR